MAWQAIAKAPLNGNPFNAALAFVKMIVPLVPFAFGSNLKENPVPNALRAKLPFLDGVETVAVVGNFYAHNNERNPWFKAFGTGVVVNNVIYNPGIWAVRLGAVLSEWTGVTIVPEPPEVTVVGNYMKYGANTTARVYNLAGYVHYVYDASAVVLAD